MATRPPTQGERIETLEKALGLFHRKTISARLRENWGLLLAVLALAVAYFAWWQPQWKAQSEEQLTRRIDERIVQHIDPLNKSIISLGERFSRLEGQMDILRPLMEDQVRKTLLRYRDLPAVKLRSESEAIQSTLKATRVLGIPVDPLQVKMIGVRASEAGAWAVASLAVDYQSSKSEFDSLRPCTQRHVNWRDNDANVALSKEIQSHQDVPLVTIRNVGFRDCTLVLDDIPAWKSLLATDPNEVKANFVTCNHCQIVYRGAPLIPIVAAVFDDCKFDFSVPDSGPPRADVDLSGHC